MSPRTLFLLINIIGGVAVLASYAWGLLTYPSLRGALWGGVPEAWRGIYSSNMPLAAAGYLAGFWYLLRHVDPSAQLGRLGFGHVNLAFAVILICSTAWMPLSLVIIDHRAERLVPIIFVVLGATALATAAVGYMLWRLPGTGLACWAARIGWCFFGLQTILLDGIVWPLMFKIKS